MGKVISLNWRKVKSWGLSVTDILKLNIALIVAEPIRGIDALTLTNKKLSSKSVLLSYNFNLRYCLIYSRPGLSKITTSSASVASGFLLSHSQLLEYFQCTFKSSENNGTRSILLSYYVLLSYCLASVHAN